MLYCSVLCCTLYCFSFHPTSTLFFLFHLLTFFSFSPLFCSFFLSLSPKGKKWKKEKERNEKQTERGRFIHSHFFLLSLHHYPLLPPFFSRTKSLHVSQFLLYPSVLLLNFMLCSILFFIHSYYSVTLFLSLSRSRNNQFFIPVRSLLPSLPHFSISFLFSFFLTLFSILFFLPLLFFVNKKYHLK